MSLHLPVGPSHCWSFATGAGETVRCGFSSRAEWSVRDLGWARRWSDGGPYWTNCTLVEVARVDAVAVVGVDGAAGDVVVVVAAAVAGGDGVAAGDYC